jgi:hypothetical protein
MHLLINKVASNKKTFVYLDQIQLSLSLSLSLSLCVTEENNISIYSMIYTNP